MDWSLTNTQIDAHLSPGTAGHFDHDAHALSVSTQGENHPIIQSPWAATDLFSHDPNYLAFQDRLRGIIFSITQSVAPTRVASPEPGDFDWEQRQSYATQSQITAQQTDIETDVNREKQKCITNTSHNQIMYLKTYVGEVAPWLDMFDSANTLGIQLPILARDFPALLYAILAISARQMERKNGARHSFDSLEFYQESIRLLGPLLQVRDEKVIATCVLLCCLEMMSAGGNDWQRHLEGCAALFNTFDIHGFSTGLLQAVFWCYARMDVCGAIISNGTAKTLLKPSRWLPAGRRHEDAHQLFVRTHSADMYANYAVYLCAKVCELLTDFTKNAELGRENGCSGPEFERRWSSLWDDLQRWLVQRPAELLPVQTTESEPFMHIFFSFWAAISSNQLYHTACIVMLEIKPSGIHYQSSAKMSSIWHARRVCGISLANPHHGCLNNAVQPLWVAGRLFSHAAEHEIIIKLLRDIESASGWAARWRIRDLRIVWGYTVH